MESEHFFTVQNEYGWYDIVLATTGKVLCKNIPPKTLQFIMEEMEVEHGYMEKGET